MYLGSKRVGVMRNTCDLTGMVNHGITRETACPPCYRGVVYQHDIVQYDNLVNKYEIEAYQKLSMKLHLPLNHRLNKKPRKTLITTEMGKSLGPYSPSC